MDITLSKELTHSDFTSHKYQNINEALAIVKEKLSEHECSIPPDTTKLFSIITIGIVSYTHPINAE